MTVTVAKNIYSFSYFGEFLTLPILGCHRLTYQLATSNFRELGHDRIDCIHLLNLQKLGGGDCGLIG